MKKFIIIFIFAVFLTATADNIGNIEEIAETVKDETSGPEHPQTETLKHDENNSSLIQARLFPIDLIGGAANYVKNATSSLINLIKPSSESIKNAENLSKFASSIKSSYIKNDRTLPEDPYQDISGFLNQKHSGDLKIDPVGALRTRESLNKMFASTKDEVLHKYGSNYNVLVPNTQYVGILRNFLDGLLQ